MFQAPMMQGLCEQLCALASMEPRRCHRDVTSEDYTQKRKRPDAMNYLGGVFIDKTEHKVAGRGLLEVRGMLP